MSGTFVTVYTSEPDTMKMKNYNIQRRGVLIMKCIGIIGAMEEEVRELIEDMTELLITQPMNDEQRHNETNKSAMIDGGNRFMSH